MVSNEVSTVWPLISCECALRWRTNAHWTHASRWCRLLIIKFHRAAQTWLQLVRERNRLAAHRHSTADRLITATPFFRIVLSRNAGRSRARAHTHAPLFMVPHSISKRAQANNQTMPYQRFEIFFRSKFLFSIQSSDEIAVVLPDEKKRNKWNAHSHVPTLTCMSAAWSMDHWMEVGSGDFEHRPKIENGRRRIQLNAMFGFPFAIILWQNRG